MNTGTEKKILNLYTLEKPSWLLDAGMSKGVYHDKQALGVVLQPGNLLRVGLLDLSFEGGSELILLNNDRMTERLIPIDRQTSEIIIIHTCVPFINTPYTGVPITLEVEVEHTSPVQALPVLNEGDDPVEFLGVWAEHLSPYALIRDALK